jgi:beta-glucosidase
MKLPLLLITPLLAAAAFAQTQGIATKNPAEIDRKAAELVAKMTLDEKIGQMIQADYLAIINAEDQITKLGMGSILNGGSSDPSADNSATAWADAVDRLQKFALATRLKVPLLYGIDAVHGNNNIVGATVFPHNVGLGATRDPKIVEAAGRITALEVLGSGPNWAFAPGVIVGRDERWGRTYESFGEDPKLVSELGAAAVRGIQTADLGSYGAVLACAKHYLGDGGTTGGKDQGNTECDENTLRTVFLTPYVAATQAGVGSVMISYSSWNGVKMHGNKHLITDVLKGELGFRGFTVSDWAAIDQLGANYSEDIEKSVNAGLDMVMIPNGPSQGNNYIDFANALRELVKSGRVPESRVTDAAERILRVKFAMDLFDHPLADRKQLAEIGSAEHRAVAREAVQKSLVLLKNERSALPIKNAKHIHVIGEAADDLGAQCGGWTVSWQGAHGPTTKGTTFLAGLRQVAPAGCTVTFDPIGTAPVGDADATIVVLSEDPYAEGFGDRKDLNLNAGQLELLKAAHQGKAPVILVVYSGRPIILGDALGQSDAVVAAWLPGTEGEGIADVVLGKVAPTGKLPMSWPRSMDQIPINVGDAKYDPLFAYGYGLTY